LPVIIPGRLVYRVAGEYVVTRIDVEVMTFFPSVRLEGTSTPTTPTTRIVVDEAAIFGMKMTISVAWGPP
jgi:hypothetical protein